MKSGGGVLLVGLLQLCIGLVLLGTYEGFKASVCDASGTCLNHGSKRLYMVRCRSQRQSGPRLFRQLQVSPLATSCLIMLHQDAFSVPGCRM